MTTDEIVPIIQTVIWVFFISLLLFLTRAHISAILKALTKNIERGSAIETPWLKVGQTNPKLDDALGNDPSPSDKLRSIYLRHFSDIWEEHKDGVNRKKLEIWIDSFDDEIWDKIEKVIYYFPKSFPQRKITRVNKEEWFSIKTAAIGEFSVGAEIYMHRNEEPIRINRYIDFPKPEDSEFNIPLVTNRDIVGVLSIQSARPDIKNIGYQQKTRKAKKAK